MFITLEGIEGSGKSTQISRLVAALEQRGHVCVYTREPGATAVGKKIRHILLDSENRGLVPLAELLLYEADRAQHVCEVIEPAVNQGKVVVSDRFFDATVVYQGYARGFNLEFIDIVHRHVLKQHVPDLTLLLDLPVEIGLKRAWKRIAGKSKDLREDRFEKEDRAFHERVRQGYLTVAEREPDRFRIIDALQDPSEVHEEILRTVLEVMDRYDSRFNQLS
jgi:dTMP kinase